MLELLTYGGIKYVLSKIIGKVCDKYCFDTLYRVDPELVYFSKNNNSNSLIQKFTKEVLNYLLYCIPHLGNVLFAISTGVSVVSCCITRSNRDVLSAKMRTKYTNPINKKIRLDSDRKFYDSKSLTDSLILDGADQSIIDEVLADVRKEIGYDYENEEIYRTVRNNVQNMSKLRGAAKKVDNPVKLYKDTKDNEITNIFISDDDLEKLVVHMNLMYSMGEFERSKTYNLKK